MPSVRISSELKDQIYFVTCTVKNWYHLFDRHNRFHILEDSFVYCQQNKNLKIYATCFCLHDESSSFYWLIRDDLGATLRDMKTFLSKEFKKSIMSYEPHVLKIFEDDGKYEFWEKTNYPKLIETAGFFQQKIDYIHHNPVRKEYVHNPEDWRWSSASKVPTKITLSSLEA